MATILITGGTGTLGKQVLNRLRGGGHELRVLSRRSHADDGEIRYFTGDLETGTGIEPAVAGADIVVHCAGSAKGDEDKTRNLVRAAVQQSSRPHVVGVSVVGADRVPVAGFMDRRMFGYFGMKLATELVIEQSGLPWTILRASQFYDLALLVLRAMSKLPVIPAPAGLRFQPVDSGEVAQRVVELALAPASGMAPDFAGPRIYEFTDLLRGYLHAAGKRRAVMPIRLPSKAAHAIRDGAVLARDGVGGTRTWEDFLTEHAL